MPRKALDDRRAQWNYLNTALLSTPERLLTIAVQCALTCRNLHEAKAKTPEPVNAHIRKLERELFHTWAFIMEEGLYSEASEYVNEHKDEETPFEW